MKFILYIAIGLLGLGSYGVGVYQIIKGSYRPNLFSRMVWLLIAINGFFGALLSKTSDTSIFLAGIIIVGSLAIALGSFWKGDKSIGTVEYVLIGLLLISGAVWLIADAPFINLIISLIAHFIGGIPTYRRVLHDPKSESKMFWLLFFLASLLSVIVSDNYNLRAIILPLYFTVFDGGMLFLSLRKERK